VVNGQQKSKRASPTGFLEKDGSAMRDPFGAVIYGRIRDATGKAKIGTKWRRCENNRWFGNVAIGTAENGVSMGNSLPFVRTYATTEWQGNNMDGSYLFSTVMGSWPKKNDLTTWQSFGLDNISVVLNAPSGVTGNAFQVEVGPTVGGFNLTLVRTVLSSNVQYHVETQPCGGSYASLKKVGTISYTRNSFLLPDCSCNEIVVRAWYQGMYGAFMRLFRNKTLIPWINNSESLGRIEKLFSNDIALGNDRLEKWKECQDTHLTWSCRFTDCGELKPLKIRNLLLFS